MSFSETIFLFFLALVIFGPKKLPEIARQVGKALNEFKRASNEFRAQIEQEIAHLEVENKQTILPPAEPPPGATSRATYAATEIEAHTDAPTLTAGAPESGSIASQSPSGHSSAVQSAPDQTSIAQGQASPSASETSEDETASNVTGTSVAPEAHISKSLAPESHA